MIARLPGRPELLRWQAFRRYWSAQTISVFGDQISSVAVPYTGILALHADAAEMGYLTAAIWLPSLLFGLHAGAWADRRGHRRRLMITADLGRAALLATVPASAALHLLTLGQLYAVAFGVGSLSVLFTVSEPALFVALVPEDQYLSGSPWSTAAGPALSSAAPAWAVCWSRCSPPRSRSPQMQCPTWARPSFSAASTRPNPHRNRPGPAGRSPGRRRLGLRHRRAAVPGPAAAHPAGRRPARPGARGAVRLGVPGRRGGDGAGHQRRGDVRRGDPGPAPVPGHRRLPGVNYGARPIGSLVAGVLGTAIGIRPTLWIATIGGCTAFLSLLPSPVLRFRLPAGAAGAAGAAAADHVTVKSGSSGPDQ